MADKPALRASDADRERVCAQLREAYAEGRLRQDEFQERTDQALAARMVADLAPLTADLPDPPPQPSESRLPPPQGEPDAATLARRHELRKIWTAWASAAILLTAVWVLTAVTTSGPMPDFWPAWPLGITGALALVRTLHLRDRYDDPRALAAARKRERLQRRIDRRLPR